MYCQYINGRLEEGKGPLLQVTNPADGSLVAEYRAASPEQVGEALEAAQAAFASWSRASCDERAAMVLRMRDGMLARRDELTEVLIKESGKPYDQAFYDVNAGIQRFTFMTEELRRIYGVTLPDYGTRTGGAYHFVEKRPVGVVVGHVAWNFPMLNISCKIAPTIASGCTGVVKPSRETPLTAMILGEIAAEAELPAGILNIVTGTSRDLGPCLNSSTIPRMITLIGSTKSGLEVMQQGATSIKKYSLELGGNAPVIILPDADIEEAADLAVAKKTTNAGQVCVCYNRFYVHESIVEAFVEAVKKNLPDVVLTTEKKPGRYIMGPLIKRSAREHIQEIIKEACEQGATLVCGGEIPADMPADGNWFTPALLTGVTDDMRISREELFAPVIAVQTWNDLDDVIRRSNDTDCGLTSYVFGHDSRALARLSEELESGEVYINNAPNGVNLPHGGIKQSGLGCDNSYFSLEEYYDNKRISLIP
ncbi:MAG: aldehyde dehydrogenase family protein [Lachnospiraceae bacterium]|nr:aldehyde dehydrogenase family protein [Lachnospiraceae bacterium]